MGITRRVFMIGGATVAEKNKDCRFAGNIEITRFMAGRNPMSSMRSASSKTKNERRERSM